MCIKIENILFLINKQIIMDLLENKLNKMRINKLANKVYNLIEENKLIDAYEFLEINKNKIYSQEYFTFKIRILMNYKKFDEVYNILINEENLMKRDYFDYIKIIYYIDMKKTLNLFTNYIKDKYILTMKDINFLIAHKLFEIIRLLKGYYINTCENGSLKNSNILHLNNFKNNNVILNIIKRMSNIMIINDINENIWNKGSGYDIIIDCGNILNSSGSIKGSKKSLSKNSYKYLFKIINEVKLYFRNPLLVIYENHLNKDKSKSKSVLKYINRLIDLNKENNNILIVPKKGIDDDIFILINSMIYKIPILSNDQFRNYINEYKSFNNDLKNFLDDYTLNHNKELNKISNWKRYSNYIHVKDENILIPTVKGEFYKIVHHSII
jgi:hypothetical protein